MKKIVLSANSSWSIYNFRLGLIKELIKFYEVIVVAPEDEFSEKLIDLGCKYYNVYIDNKGTNPFKDIKTFWNYFKIYKNIKPDLIFHYTVKPNIYGTLAAGMNKIPSIAITTGLGYAFINNNLITKIVKVLYKISLKFAKQVWFLNYDDKNIFINYKIISKYKADVLPSEGINIEEFKPIKLEKNTNVVRFLLIARMLWDKGIYEYVKAAQLIKQNYDNVEFCLLGASGVDNPKAIEKDLIEKWQSEGIVRYLGVTNDVKKEIAKSDCIVLPSYREGMPRTLLEAASMERPIITTDVPGCREVVNDGFNGFLCRIKDSKDLASKMEKMLNLSEDERIEMGKKGREKIIKEFEEKIVIEKYLKITEEYLNSLNFHR